MGATDQELEARLSALGKADLGREVARLDRRLAARAEAEGPLDLTYRTIATPVGELLLAATRRGLVRVAFATEGHQRVLAELAVAISPRILADAGRLEPAARELEEYFSGRRRNFDLKLDLSLAHGFRLSVLERLRTVGYGVTLSYSALAAAAGSPRAARAVGSACATNPVPIVVPCHRVVRGDGALGGYGGGLDAKRALLALEGAA